MRCFIDSKLNNWDEWISYACFMYNTTPHTVTKFSPYEVLFGRKCNLPESLQKTPQPLYNYEDIVKIIKFKLQNCHAKAQENLINFKQKQQRKVKSNAVAFKKNDIVLLKIEARGKLEPLWKGPYEIKKVEWLGHYTGNRKTQTSGSTYKQVKTVSFFLAGNIKIALMLIMVLHWGYTKAQEVESIKMETGIYFDEIGIIRFYPIHWKVVSYINLEPTRNLWQSTKAHQKKVLDSCKKTETEKWYHLTNCAAFQNYIYPKMRAIDNL